MLLYVATIRDADQEVARTVEFEAEDDGEARVYLEKNHPDADTIRLDIA